MQFWRDGNVLFAARITGPTHNLVGIEVAEQANGATAVVQVGPAQPELISRETVLGWVESAVAGANRQLGTHFHCKQVHYRADDSPDAKAYEVMVLAILRKLSRDEAL